jgi:hypothetical protein
MATNIFGEHEHEPVYEMLYCPAGCEYTRFGSRDLEQFRCHTCKRDMVNESELDIIEQRKARKADDAALQSLTNFIVWGNG